jgi:hypothetical protein
MGLPTMRPCFALQLVCGKDEALAAIKKQLSLTSAPVDGKISGPHLVLTTCVESRKLWSPRLNVTLEDTHVGATLWCQFAPYPQVWTGFVASYAALAFLGLSGAMYGMAEVSLGRTPWGLLVPLVTGTIAAGLYGATFVGQGLASEEMEQLRAFLKACFDDTVIAGEVSV